MKSLAESYRPTSSEEIKGQPHAQIILDLTETHISPSYLFYGASGCGKTSTAKVLISKLENISTDQFAFYGNDIIIHNCATAGGVDQIKELIFERCQYPPARLKRKYVLLDEAHSLSNVSQNALLDILEAPPDYLTFILCTTEYKKILQTIRSRCLQVKFNEIDSKIIFNILLNICKKEKIQYDDQALQMISENCHGSPREAIMTLSQYQKIGAIHENIKQFLGYITQDQVIELLKLSTHGKRNETISMMNEMIKTNAKPEEILKISLLIVCREIENKLLNIKTELNSKISLIKLSNIISEHIRDISPIMPDNLNLQMCFYKILSISGN